VADRGSVPTPRGEILRFTRIERAQHWVLIVTLTLLGLTGVGLVLHDTWFGRVLIALEGGVESRGTIHRAAAVALMALVAWHFLYVVFTDRGHRQLMEMVPHGRDFGDVGRLLAYYLGARPEPPEFGRYTPMQKLQYWGAGLGSLLMIATGLALWMHTSVMAVAPKWLIDVTTIVHGYEGLILFILLFGWHLYIVHLSPGNFPMQRTFLNGRIDTRRLWQEHRREYRELFGDEPPETGNREEQE
jgi:formate dehydrogenase subunit gamma